MVEYWKSLHPDGTGCRLFLGLFRSVARLDLQIRAREIFDRFENGNLLKADAYRLEPDSSSTPPWVTGSNPWKAC